MAGRETKNNFIKKVLRSVPKVGKLYTMIRRHIHLTKEQDKRLAKQAKKSGLKFAEIIRRAVDFYLEYMTGKKAKP